MTTFLATPKQIDFINTLIAKREVPLDITAAIRAQVGMTTKQASAWIDTLKGYGYRQTTPFSAYLAAFEGVEDSKYAIPAEYLTLIPTLNGIKGLLFLEVKTWRGKRYLNRLHGAPGDFVRSRFPMQEGILLLQMIKGRHVEFAQTFGEHFTCCGRCSAPLTDERSREIHLGPDCRKVWGL